MNRIDLNADLGESGTGAASPDAAIMPAISSANIACGFHAGDEDTMRATVALAVEHGVAVGAHPSFADREGFGRREISLPPAAVEELVVRQISALAGIAAARGARLRHVKPHGALYNMAARDRALADAIARAVVSVDSSLILFGLSGSELVRAAEEAGLVAASEVFADRAYRRDGSLVPRGTPGAVMHDAEVVAARAVSMVKDREVVAVDGSRVPLAVDTICLHGDTPGAVVTAMRIRHALEAAGITVTASGLRP